jgi:hypothetical protein
LHNARNDWGKSADNGQETCKYNCLTTMFFIESFCVVQVLFLKKEIVLSLKQVSAAFFAKPVTDHISEDPADGNQNPENDQIREIAARTARDQFVNKFLAVDSCHKKKTVAWQEKADHESGFGKNYKKHYPETAVIDIKFRIQQVPKCDCQKSSHINTLARIGVVPVTGGQIKI